MKFSQLMSYGFGMLMVAGVSFAQAAPQQLTSAEKDFLTVDSIKITPVATTDMLPLFSPCFKDLTNCPTNMPTTQPSGPIGGIGSIVSIGEGIWRMVEAGKPSAHIVSNSVSALPRENPHWTLMTDWQGPLVKGYHMEVLNKLGMKVVTMDYKILAYYGGKYQGKGSYLTNLTMITDNVSVSWGYDLQATAELMDMVNTTDDLSPVPGCTMQMKWRTDTAIQHREGSHSIFVKGDGSVKELN